MYTTLTLKETCVASTQYLSTLQDPHNEKRLFPLTLITLENKFKKNSVSVMNILLICLFSSMNLEKEHKKLLGSSFKIMLPQ
jgi:hypothetical protein